MWISLLQESTRSRLAEGFKTNQIFPGIMTKSSRVPLEHNPRSFCPFFYANSSCPELLQGISAHLCLGLSSLAGSPPPNPGQGIPDHFRAEIPKTELGNPRRRHSPNFQCLNPKAWILCSALPSRRIFIQRFY